jgi:hypothetical protein
MYRRYTEVSVVAVTVSAVMLYIHRKVESGRSAIVEVWLTVCPQCTRYTKLNAFDP